MNRSQLLPAMLFLATILACASARYSLAETLTAQAAGQRDASPAPSTPPDPAKADDRSDDNAGYKADYEAAERLDSLGGWDVFLAQHPTGDYTAPAQERRAKAAARLAALPGSGAAPGSGPNGASQTTPAVKSGLSYLGTVECAAKFQAAKVTGKLKGRKWADFRAAECGPQAARASVETSSVSGPAAAPAPSPAGEAVFPPAIDPKYAKDFSDKGRMLTCADQFKVNKAANANGGMRWIDKGGGYYAECNRRLKGA